MDGEDGGIVVMGRAEIDMRAPFRSVKEAVMLFGEKVLVGEIYANKLKEMRAETGEKGQGQSRLGTVTAELEETKQRLQKAREESNMMACCIKTLREELEQAKKELQQLREGELQMQERQLDPEIEDLKFVENTKKLETMIKKQTQEEYTKQFQNKRYVTFASPPSLAQVMVSKEEQLLERPTGLKKGRKKSLVPLMGWLFSKKKGNQEACDSPREF